MHNRYGADYEGAISSHGDNVTQLADLGYSVNGNGGFN